MPAGLDQRTSGAGDLRTKREALVARGVELGEERTKISFAAHAGPFPQHVANAPSKSSAVHPSSRPAQEQAEVVAGQPFEQLKQCDFITLLGGRRSAFSAPRSFGCHQSLSSTGARHLQVTE